MDFKIASTEEMRTAFAQVHGLWSHADDPDVHLQRRMASIQHKRATWFVLREGEDVVASCGAYPFRLFGPDGERAARGFGAVFTPPEKRGRGLSAQLLRAVMDHYQNAGTRDFFLFSDIAPQFYEKLGFHKLPSWEFAITAEPLPAAFRYELESVPVLADAAGAMGCSFGISRSHEENVWCLARENGELRKSLIRDRQTGTTPYWMISVKRGQDSVLLESNMPQDRAFWPSFRTLVAAEGAGSAAKVVRGWWTTRNPEPSVSPEIHERTLEILMWASQQGSQDPWLPAITQTGFRTFLSEHV